MVNLQNGGRFLILILISIFLSIFVEFSQANTSFFPIGGIGSNRGPGCVAPRRGYRFSYTSFGLSSHLYSLITGMLLRRLCPF